MGKRVTGLSAKLLMLQDRGCYPEVHYRGGLVWRAHVNSAGNIWDEGSTPLAALTAAIKLWKDAGEPMDGYAVMPQAQQKEGGRQ